VESHQQTGCRINTPPIKVFRRHTVARSECHAVAIRAKVRKRGKKLSESTGPVARKAGEGSVFDKMGEEEARLV